MRGKQNLSSGMCLGDQPMRNIFDPDELIKAHPQSLTMLLSDGFRHNHAALGWNLTLSVELEFGSSKFPVAHASSLRAHECSISV